MINSLMCVMSEEMQHGPQAHETPIAECYYHEYHCIVK